MPFLTFGLSDPQPDPGLAAARVDGQETMLAVVGGTLLDRAASLSAASEGQLMSVVRELTAEANRRVASGGVALGGVMTAAASRNRTILSGQTARFTSAIRSVEEFCREGLCEDGEVPDGWYCLYTPSEDTFCTFEVANGKEPGTGSLLVSGPHGSEAEAAESCGLPQGEKPPEAPGVNGDGSPGKEAREALPACPAPQVIIIPPSAVPGAAVPPVVVVPPAAGVVPGQKEPPAQRPPFVPGETSPDGSIEPSVPRVTAGETPARESPPPRGPGQIEVAGVQDVAESPLFPPARNPTALVPPRIEEGLSADPAMICRRIDEYVAFFAQFGARMVPLAERLLESTTSLDDLIGFFTRGLSALSEFWRGSVLGDAPRQLFASLADSTRQFGAVVQVIRNGLFGALALLRTHEMHMEVGKAQALSGFYLARAFLGILENLYVGWDLGPVAAGQFRLELTQLKLILDYCVEYAMPIRIPGVPDIETLYMSGVANDQESKCLFNLHGDPWNWRQRVLYAKRSQTTDDALIRSWLRLQFPMPELQARLRNRGWLDTRDQAELVDSYRFVPPPSDLIRFAIRDVFDPAKLGKAEMLAELAQQKDLLGLFRSQGIMALPYQDVDGQNKTADIPSLYWMASYEEVSPTQVFEMLHRLRPGRVRNYPLPGQAGQVSFPEPVNIGHVRLLLKEKDYNPIWRDRLASISYRVIGRIDLRRLYDAGVLGEPRGTLGFGRPVDGRPNPTGPAEVEVWESYQDQGYSPRDAALLTLWQAKASEASRLNKQRTRGVAILCKTYQAGAIGKKELTDRLRLAGQTEQEAVAFADNCDAERRLKDVGLTLRALRTAFLGGILDRFETQGQLARIGLVPERVAETLQTWTIERAARPKEPDAQRMCGWYQQGLITIPDMRTRLIRQGWTAVDAERIIRHCVIGFSAKSAAERDKRAKAQFREAERVRAVGEKRREMLTRDIKEQQRRLLANRPDKYLVAWIKAGLIDEPEVRATLRVRGMSVEDVDRWWTTYGKKDK